MAWIKNGKIYKIVNAMSETNFTNNINSHKERGWNLVGDIKRDKYGFSCLMFCERKGLRDSNKI